MDSYQRAARKLYVRVAISVAAMCTFIGLGVHAAFIAQGRLGLVAVVPLAVAVIALPRHTRKGALAGLGSSEEPGHKELRMKLAKLSNLSTVLRIAYLGIALIIFFLLPRLVPAAS